MTFAELLVRRLSDMNATQADLSRWLTGRGIPTTRQAVSDWCDGTSRPRGWKWSALFHLLAVTGTDKDVWTDALLAKSVHDETDDSPAPAPSDAGLDAPDSPLTVGHFTLP